MVAIDNELDQRYPVSSLAVQQFARDGFLRLQGVLSPEILRTYEPEITRQVIELNTEELPLAERDTYRKAFLQIMNLWRHSAVVREFVFSRRLARIAADLLEVDAVRLYHDQALYKEPGGGITPWHADQYYWPFSSDRCVTAWVPLQETPMEMGPLAFAEGSHRFEFGRDLPISDESECVLQEALAAQEFPEVSRPFELGDASFHLGWTFHRAGPNSAEVPRRVMTIIYMDAEMTVTKPVNAYQVNDINTWMPGIRAGQKAASPLNPVLFQRHPTDSRS